MATYRSQALVARNILLALNISRDGAINPAQAMAVRTVAARNVKIILDARAYDLLPDWLVENWLRFQAWGWHEGLPLPVGAQA
jgi:hypothetical protein